MLIYKCDICKKEIKDGQPKYQAGKNYHSNIFCEKCGKPIEIFLKKNKLLPKIEK